MIAIVFIYTVVIVTVITLHFVEPHFVNDKEMEELELVTSYANSKHKLDTLCDLPKEKKLAICKMILEQDKYIEDLDIYFNTAAAYYLQPDCEERTLTFQVQTEFNAKEREIKRKMFPCYGRHYPVRTHWKIDDHFDSIYISGGSVDDSLFVYFHAKNADSDIYNVRDLFLYANIDRLSPVIVTESETKRELKSLRRFSFNSNTREIENNYIRELIKKEELRLDPICALDVEQKLWLCETILLRDLYRSKHEWTIDEPAFQRYPVQCEEKYIEFEHHSDYNQRINKRKMFPCHGKPVITEPGSSGTESGYLFTEFNMSGGFRENSVVVYIKHDDAKYGFYEFVENVRLEFRSNEMTVIDDVEEVQNFYVQSFVVQKVKPDTLCDLPKERKLAVCNAILKRGKYARTMKIFFNKAAAFHLDPDCVDKVVALRTTTYPYRKTQQKMFPCYGRNDPMRGDWRVDDYFDLLYLSGGTEDDSVLVYIREKTTTTTTTTTAAEWDLYNLHELVVHVGIDYLRPLYIGEHEVKEELKSLQRMTHDFNRFNIELNYVREVFEKHITIADPFCDLPKDKKLRLCDSVLEHYFDPDWIVDDDKFFNESTDCTEKYVKFEHFDDLESVQKMFPCYGQSQNENRVDLYYLSGGYRENSVIIYVLNSQPAHVRIGAFVDNVYLGFCPATKQSNRTDLNILENAYIESYIKRDIKPKTLCDLPESEKFALCSAVLENYPDIYFNKVAHFYKNVHCVENPLIFRSPSGRNYQNTKQKMFPCFGRHDPVRTSWYEDYFVGSFFISGGPEYDSLFVYIRSLRIPEDIFGIYELITDAGIDYVPPIKQIYAQELEEERLTLNRLSVSERLVEMEHFYHREVIFKSAITEPDAVCDLPRRKKLSLCRKIYENLSTNIYNDNQKINEEEFKSHPTECISKKLRFQAVPILKDSHEIERKMFPCHGIDANNNYVALFYLCSGYRGNSVSAFRELANYPDICTFSAFIENLRLTELEDAAADSDNSRDD